MEIGDFTYRQTPVKKTRIYEVHTLSQDGLNQYIDRNSYVHNYLKSKSPYRTNFNNFYDQENYPLEENMKACLNNNNFNKTIKDSYYNKNKRDNGTVITINMNNFHKNIYYKPASELANFDSKENNEKVFNDYNAYKNYNNERENHFNENNNNPNKNNYFEENKNSENKKTLEDRKNAENYSCASEIQQSQNNHQQNNKSLIKKNTFLQTSKQVFTNQKSLNNNMNKFNKQKYSEDYIYSINNLKEKLKENFFSNTSKNSNSPNRINYGNFKSYEVPHLDYKRSSSNFRINMIRDKLENTLLKNGKNTNVNYSSNIDLDTINKKIEIENMKLKNYFDNINKFAQKDNQGFYPSVSQITNSKNLRTTKVKIMNNKYMGERYDPTNFA